MLQLKDELLGKGRGNVRCQGSNGPGVVVESEASVRAFSPSSTLEPGVKAFCRCGPKCSL
jgi:hypothetical protein